MLPAVRASFRALPQESRLDQFPGTVIPQARTYRSAGSEEYFMTTTVRDSSRQAVSQLVRSATIELIPCAPWRPSSISFPPARR